MTGNLARTTTYIDKDILWMAKTKALRDNAGVYEILNNWLRAGARMGENTVLKVQNLKFDDVVKTKPLGIKGNLNRRQIYAWI